jgi:hypothetical protein
LVGGLLQRAKGSTNPYIVHWQSRENNMENAAKKRKNVILYYCGMRKKFKCQQYAVQVVACVPASITSP